MLFFLHKRCACAGVFACLVLLLSGCLSQESRRDSFIQNGVRLEQKGQYAEAKIEAKNALKLDDTSLPAYLLLARCFEKEKDWRGAYVTYNRMLEIEPENKEALIGLARFLVTANSREKALELIKTLKEQYPDSVEVKLLTVALAAHANDVGVIERELHEVLALDPENKEAVLGLVAVYRGQKNTHTLDALFARYIPAWPDFLPLLQQAVVYAVEKHDAVAAAAYMQQYASRAQGASDFLQLGARLQRMGKPEMAESLLRGGLVRYPEAEDVYYALVALLVEQKQSAQAMALLQQMPKSSDKQRLLLAALLLEQGKTQEGMQVLHALVGTASSAEVEVAARLHLVDLYTRQNEVGLARHEVEQVLTRYPRHVKALLVRSHLFMQEKQFELAVSDLRQVVLEEPQNVESQFLLAQALHASGNILGAEVALKEVLRRKVDFTPAYSFLAQIVYARGERKAAFSLLQEGKNQASDAFSLCLVEADFLIHEKEFVAAKHVYETFLERMPEKKEPLLIALARLAAMQKDFVTAGSLYKQVVEEFPQNVQAAMEYTNALLAVGRNAFALEWAAAYSAKYPDSLQAHLNFGNAALAGHAFAQAENVFLRVLEEQSHALYAATRLVDLYIAWQKMDKAIVYCRYILDRTTADTLGTSLLLASLEFRYGSRDAALEIYRSLLVQHAHNENVVLALVDVLSDSTASEKELREAFELAVVLAQSASVQSLSALGWVEFRLAQYADAELHLRHALGQRPEDPVILVRLASVLLAVGKTAEARAYVQTVLAMEHVAPEIREQAAVLAKQIR